jgi:hypothetical protein
MRTMQLVNTAQSCIEQTRNCLPVQYKRRQLRWNIQAADLPKKESWLMLAALPEKQHIYQQT